MDTVLLVVLAVLLAGLVVLEVRRHLGGAASPASEQSGASQLVTEELNQAREQLQEMLGSQRSELESARQDLDRRLNEVRLSEAEVSAREARASADRQGLERERLALERRTAAVAAREESVARELEQLAGLDLEQARAAVIAKVERAARLSAVHRAREIEAEALRDAEIRARDVLVTTMQRLAASSTAESVVSTVELPSDEMKGRIIGREGRNIRHFEQVTGVNVMIDDTPGSVLLSCFDPVRRECARVTLMDLIADGRIHPARIEEAYERSKQSVLELCRRAAESALLDLGITDIDPALVEVIGTLRYRTSYGQNVLAHMLECGQLAGMLAAELGLNPASCARAAFLHDIGKAVVLHGEGSHALEGAQLARRHGEDEVIVNAIAAHHNEVPVEYVESVLVQIADAISGSRPGARRESLEAYVHRLERLEQIAGAHEGVDKVFAMQAGREVRVMVQPDRVDDAAGYLLARQIADEIEEELTYPGTIRVTVVRESRATELAR